MGYHKNNTEILLSLFPFQALSGPRRGPSSRKMTHMQEETARCTQANTDQTAKVQGLFLIQASDRADKSTRVGKRRKKEKDGKSSNK